MMFISLVLPLLFGELFILHTNADFYVEITERRANDAKITLYECASDPEHVPMRADHVPSPDRWKPRKIPAPQDRLCIEMKNRKAKKRAYSIANFYMVADTELVADKRIYLQTNNGKRGGSSVALGAASPSVSIAIGVVIMRAMHDVPKFEDVSEHADAQSYLYSEIKNAPFIASVLDEDEYKLFLQYYSIESFNTVLNPTAEDIKRFGVFNKVIQQVDEMYTRDVRLAKLNKVDNKAQSATKSQVAAAAKLLIQKLIDPCLFMAGTWRDALQSKKEASKMAKTQCRSYCTFLAAVFKSNSITSSKCNGKKDTLVDGICYIFRCYCEMKSYMMKMPEPEKYFTMIECSNDLRQKMSAVTLKTPSLATLSSIRQSFSRFRPSSFRSQSSKDSFNGRQQESNTFR